MGGVLHEIDGLPYEYRRQSWVAGVTLPASVRHAARLF